MLDGGAIDAGKYATPNQTPDYSYGVNIDSVHNNEAAPTTIALPFNLVTSQDSPTYSSANLILHIAIVIYQDISYGEGMVLNPSFPASEPIVGDRQTLFGKIFGVHFQANHGGWFSRPISSKELL